MRPDILKRGNEYVRIQIDTRRTRSHLRSHSSRNALTCALISSIEVKCGRLRCLQREKWPVAATTESAPSGGRRFSPLASSEKLATWLVAGFRAWSFASASSVMSERPNRCAASTISLQYSAGMRPRRFISEVVDEPTPRRRATRELPPRAPKMSETDMISVYFMTRQPNRLLKLHGK